MRPWSAGAFVMTDSQPYRDADGQTRVLPFVSYRSPVLEWYGPFVRARVLRAENWSLGLRGQVDFGAYDEDDSDILQGLGDRKTTFLLGMGIEGQLSQNWSLSLSADRDALERHEGTEAVLGLSRRFGHPRAPFSASASTGIRFQDKRWTRDRVGVPGDKAREDRPAYSPDLSIHPYLSTMVLYRFQERWMATAGLRYEWLDTTWQDSPLVSDRGRLTSMFTLSRSF